ncbi:peptide ABC transporter substrate-binding protein [Paenibacillus senegalensis]|uniref:peptide ABC transporter substrate-binding protein n=1 Tax=Paenibacillus senegalensis TaxID=1465766 RepID=UPI0002896EBC|nr:peptide ABC transporter substrate-binding protein [Paenibacillus senegalensis]
MKKGWLILVSLCLIGGLLAGCTTASEGTGGGEGDAGGKKILTYSMGAEPGTLDSNKSVDDMSNEILFHISEGLVRNINNETKPGIAERWDVSDDGLTYTFYLRESVWSDGVPLTAHDFEYTFKRFLDPATGSSFVEKVDAIVNAMAYNRGEITDASQVGVKALDDHTLEIKLEYPVPYFLVTIGSNSYFYPVRQDVVEEHGSNYAADADKIVTNGPFTLERWNHEAEIRMVKNENYWNADAIKLDGITQLIVPDSNTAANMFDTGELDYLPSIPAALITSYPNAENSLAGGVQMLQFNLDGDTPESQPLMSNVNFRKALSYALNRNNIAAAIAPPGTEPAGRFVLPTFTSYLQEHPFEGVPLEGDEDKAREYLQIALDELGMSIDELPVIRYVGMDGRNRVYAEALQDAWVQVLGLNNIEIQILPVPQAIEATMNREYDIYLQSLTASRDVSELFDYWVAGGSVNWTGWDDEVYTEMYQEAMRIVDPAERDQALFEVEKYMFENGPLEPFMYVGNSYVVHDYVSGIIRSAVGAPSQMIYADIAK